MSKKKIRNSEYSGYPFKHYIDDDNKVIYVFYNSWAGSMGAHTLGKRIWPDYTIKHTSQEEIHKLHKTNERKH